MFIAALFTVVKTWKQPRYSLTIEQIKKMWYTHTHTHTYNGILLSHKKNKFESVLVRWMNLEPVIKSEVNQKEKNKYHILMYIYGL